jgi:hypothetical protein
MWITREYMKKKGSCLGTLCSVFNRLKSGFSQEDFGSLVIDNSCHPPPPCLGSYTLGASYWLIMC